MQNHVQISYVNNRLVLTAERVAAVSEPLTHPIYSETLASFSVGTILVICQYLKLDISTTVTHKTECFCLLFQSFECLKVNFANWRVPLQYIGELMS